MDLFIQVIVIASVIIVFPVVWTCIYRSECEEFDRLKKEVRDHPPINDSDSPRVVLKKGKLIFHGQTQGRFLKYELNPRVNDLIRYRLFWNINGRMAE